MNDCLTGVEARKTPLRISSLVFEVSTIRTASFASLPSSDDAILPAIHSLRSREAPSLLMPALMRAALSSARAPSPVPAPFVEHAGSVSIIAADIEIARAANL